MHPADRRAQCCQAPLGGPISRRGLDVGNGLSQALKRGLKEQFLACLLCLHGLAGQPTQGLKTVTTCCTGQAMQGHMAGLCIGCVLNIVQTLRQTSDKGLLYF